MLNDNPYDSQSNGSSASAKSHAVKPLVLLLLGAGVVVFFVFFRDELSLASVAQYEASMRQFTTEHLVWSLLIALAVYVAVTGLSLPGAAVMSLVIGWLFGFWPALVVVSFGSTAGATLAFLISRYLFRDVLQAKFGDRLASFNAALAKEGAFYLFTLRLIVAVPFFVINLVMGLTPIKARTFWWVSQLGMLPGTAVYVWAGSSVPTLKEIADRGTASILSWQLIVAFAMLGLFPIAIKKTMAAVQRHGNPEKSEI